VTVGIVSYGAYIPRLRISREEYQKAWGVCGADIKEKTVMEFDEDTLTMGVEAAKDCLRNVDSVNIGSLALASTSFPYEEKVLSGTIASMLGLSKHLFTAEYTQSTQAGLEALITSAQALENAKFNSAMVIASDAPIALPKNTIEHGLGAGAAAFLLGKENIIAEIEYVTSYVAENMGERYRLDGNNFISDIGVKSFTGIAFSELAIKAARDVFQTLGRTSKDYRFFVIQEMDGKSPKSISKKLGFGEEQVIPGLLYGQIGDTGAAGTLLSLNSVLDVAEAGDKILMIGYGSGAGSKGISFNVKDKKERMNASLRQRLEIKKSINYVQYLKLKRQI